MVNRQLELSEQLPLIAKALTSLALLMCIAGLVFVLKSQGSELSIMTMIASVIIASTIYLFNLLLVGISEKLLMLTESIPSRPVTQTPIASCMQKKAINFGLCSFCNQFETKNTLSGRYVCSDCYKVFLAVRAQSTESNVTRFKRLSKVG
ncbi:hypothetical protein [Shewanella fidelis]|uniref:hypothetical protein n=1 Tax=Shewanella fidelis TaxID=173509 RepID=UPI00048C5A4B|nr:hypothetical protein [Shewanella fidelis]